MPWDGLLNLINDKTELFGVSHLSKSAEIFKKEWADRKDPIALDEHIESMIWDAKWAILFQAAYAQDKTESPIETILYLHLFQCAKTYKLQTGKDIIINPQYQIGKYRVDFMIEWNEKKIVIECDGHEFHEKTKEQVSRDKKRDRFITMQGYKLLRFSGSEICNNIHEVLDDIYCLADEEYKRVSLSKGV